MSIGVCSILQFLWLTAGDGSDQIKFLHRGVVLTLAVKGHPASDLSGCELSINRQSLVSLLDASVVLALADKLLRLSNDSFELNRFRILWRLEFCWRSGLPRKNRLNVNDKQQSQSDNQSKRRSAYNSATHSHS